jgi:hypothetical protein
MQMKTKNLMVSFIAIAMALFLVTTVSAAEIADANGLTITVDKIDVANSPAVIAGENVEVEVQFTANVDASDVRIKVEIEGDKVDVDTVSESFDIEAGHSYKKSLTLRVPYELKDSLSSNVELEIKVWNAEHKTENESVLKVQRPSYNVDFKSIGVPQTVTAGQTFPVDLVLKNIGYKDLEDIYVVAKLTGTGIEKTVYFGDLVSNEWNYSDCCDDENTDTINGRIYLEVPYDLPNGVYSLEIQVSTSDLDLSETTQITISNEFPNTITKTEEGLFIVNPTNSLRVYKVVFPSNEMFVTVQAGSTEFVEVNADSEIYTVNVFTMNGDLVGSYNFSEQVSEEGNSAIVVLTIILAIIFLVLLIVLIVLIGKKPQKTEEFGESYY